MQTDLDDIVRDYEGFLVDVAALTGRPTSKLLHQACAKVFDHAKDAECEMFGRQLTLAFSHCRSKLHSMNTGCKLAPATRAVCLAIGKSIKGSPQKEAPVPPIPATWGGGSSSSSRVKSESSACEPVFSANFVSWRRAEEANFRSFWGKKD